MEKFIQNLKLDMALIKNIAVINYGAGNITSIVKVLKSLGHRIVVVDEGNKPENVDLILIPGVGAFASAMMYLKKIKGDVYINSHIKAGKPVIGICLGMQLFASSSTEFEKTLGLNIIPGEVNSIRNSKINVGWKKITVNSSDSLFLEFNNKYYYFNHSYMFYCDNKFILAQVSCTPGDELPAIIKKDKIVGLQFHPEKSQKNGAYMLGKLIENLCYE